MILDLISSSGLPLINIWVESWLAHYQSLLANQMTETEESLLVSWSVWMWPGLTRPIYTYAYAYFFYLQIQKTVQCHFLKVCLSPSLSPLRVRILRTSVIFLQSKEGRSFRRRLTTLIKTYRKRWTRGILAKHK